MKKKELYELLESDGIEPGMSFSIICESNEERVEALCVLSELGFGLDGYSKRVIAGENNREFPHVYFGVSRTIPVACIRDSARNDPDKIAYDAFMDRLGCTKPTHDLDIPDLSELFV